VAGARGGAPFAAACMKLLYKAGRPIWPWDQQAEHGVIVEAFPAAQLYVLGLPFQGYSGLRSRQAQARKTIVASLSDKLSIPGKFHSTLENCADALDAVLCAFSAIALSNRLMIPHLGQHLFKRAG